MTSGFDELSLAVFTALSPAGVVAFICMAAALFRPSIDSDEETKINRYLAVPYAVALVGFIASATHLGTPANALHVFWGIGRSPLSNEVFAAVSFLLLGGSYWMMAFKEHFPRPLARAWIALTAVAGIAFVAMTSLAYSVNTVPTWDTLYTPANLVFTALLAGPVLALLTATLAHLESRVFDWTMFAVAAVALVAGSIVLFMHDASLGNVANYEIVASDLVPDYPVMIWAHIATGLVGLTCAAASIRRDVPRRTTFVLRLFACLLIFSSVLVTRLVFYFLHMTVGF